MRFHGSRICHYVLRQCSPKYSAMNSQFWFFWALASSPHPSAILNVFGLIMIETTSRGCFNHAQNNHVSTMIRAMH